jgi:crotonobetainyl-CoA:carnitine CoA-transferase CaiB-like acyl-CoA transferase
MSAIGLTEDIWTALGGPEGLVEAITFTGEGDLSSAYPVSDFASAAIASAALSIAELLGPGSFPVPLVTVDRRLSSFWFGWSIRPIGWKMPATWDPLSGDYRARDGWIRLHTNAPHHRAIAERILGKHGEKAEMASAVAAWATHDLESAIVHAGGCAAEMRSAAEWAAHPQGRAVAAEPLVQLAAVHRAGDFPWVPHRDRPLEGLRVLDLTRVLAGPVASRFLAGYGADILRIDPPGWDEPGVVPEVTLGKRCARLDLERASDRRTFEHLLTQTDILLHGYRPGALDRLGYDAAARRAISPALIDISLNAYGWSGPWSSRRGFDSLVQMSVGIAKAGMDWKQADTPIPLPVQALDQATGYLMAATAVRSIHRRMDRGETTTAQLSLARTAKLLTDMGERPMSSPLMPEDNRDLSSVVEHTAWGDARRLAPPAAVAGAPMRWDIPALKLGSGQPAWH